MALKAEDALAISMKYTDEHGGGGGTSDYTSLKNKPQINNVTLTGNKTTEDLIPIGNGLNFNEDGELEVTGSETTYDDLQGKPKINNVELSGNKTSTDLGLMSEYDIDNTPTESSENLISSGAVWNADKNINDKLQGTKTVTGNPITITDAEAMNAESVIVELEPIQDLHGYDSPWVGGVGKNKLVYPYVNSSQTVSGVTFTMQDDGTVNINGTATATISFILADKVVLDNIGSGDFILNGCVQGGATDESTYFLGFYAPGKSKYDFGSGTTISLSGNEDVSSNVYIRINNGYTANNLVFKPMLRLATETDADFEPYSNTDVREHKQHINRWN